MGIFVINLCATAAAIWLVASFSHIIIAWNNFHEHQKMTRLFWVSHLNGFLLLIIALTILWSVHVNVFISNSFLLEVAFSLLIAIGIPIVKFPIKRLYTDLKKYGEN